MLRTRKMRRHARLWATRAAALLLVVGIVAQTAAAKSTLILKCADGDPSSLVMVGKNQPSDVVCDADATRDGVCLFAASCPLCSLATPPCLAPCSIQPVNLWASVPVTRSKTVTFGERTVVFRCDAGVHPKHRR